MKTPSRLSAMVAMFLATGFSAEAWAGTYVNERSNGRVTVETVVEFGTNVQPVTINENSQVNIARVIEIGETGPVDVTILQNGTRNIADVFQIGSATDSLIAQAGVSNSANVLQFGGDTNSAMLQVGAMNSGYVQQFGRGNQLPMGRR